MPEADRAYVASIVAFRAGVPQEEIRTRVDHVPQEIEDAKTPALQAADETRKSAATVALLGALSLLVGGFTASAAAALGGRKRHDEAALVLKA